MTMNEVFDVVAPLNTEQRVLWLIDLGWAMTVSARAGYPTRQPSTSPHVHTRDATIPDYCELLAIALLDSSGNAVISRYTGTAVMAFSFYLYPIRSTTYQP